MSETTPNAPKTERPARPRTYAKPPRGTRTVLSGQVVSSGKMAKTIVVEVERIEKHEKYKKYIRRHSKVYAHDEKGDAKLGDTVTVFECRPYSKLKKYRLGAVLHKATQ
jgi:small subunit ribosomal protein S17